MSWRRPPGANAGVAVNSPAPPGNHRPRLGVALFMGNLVVMALLGALVKHLSGRYPVSEILFPIRIRYFRLSATDAGGGWHSGTAYRSTPGSRHPDVVRNSRRRRLCGVG